MPRESREELGVLQDTVGEVAQHVCSMIQGLVKELKQKAEPVLES